MFKWLTPEGMLFYYNGTRFNINSIFKMEHFLKNKELIPKNKDLETEENSEGEEGLDTENTTDEDEEEDKMKHFETKNKEQKLNRSKKDQEDFEREFRPRKTIFLKKWKLVRSESSQPT